MKANLSDLKEKIAELSESAGVNDWWCFEW